jgi:hypothetical protein
MPLEFFHSASKSTHSHIPILIKLAVLRSFAKQADSFNALLVRNIDHLIELLDLAASKPKANEAAMSLLFSEKQVQSLPDEFFSRLQGIHLPLIPASSFQFIRAHQFEKLIPQVIAAITFEQFNQLRPEVKMAMTVEQAQAFPQDFTEARDLKVQRIDISKQPSQKFHPCSAVVLAKDCFSAPVTEILQIRCQWHIKNDAQSRFSSQILAFMMVTILLFIITI